ncbi:hypothetical protein ACH5AL_05390 [Actinacidiphila glaucinigra]|uniref:hypothetical protein n=1 Tax=Actinacidiphila glaucinigra TaxID=235986 RepID=UPI00378C831C
MTTPTRPPLKSIPATDGPRLAEPAHGPAAGGAPKVVAREGVLSVLRPDPSAGDGRTPVAWLTVSAPTSWRRVATARSWCACGFDRKATGKADVLRLIDTHTAHRDVCPLRTETVRRKAA